MSVLRWFRRTPLPLAPPALERPAWVDELAAALQKQTRAATKQTARLEAAVGELDARVAQLAAELGQTRGANEAFEANEAESYELVFDALDALDAARELAADPHLAEGLARVGERLELFCASRGFRRVTSLGAAPDGNLMRVVGTERSAQPPGQVLRVVRAALLRGEQLVREGSVIISAREEQHGQRLGH